MLTVMLVLYKLHVTFLKKTQTQKLKKKPNNKP